MPFGASSQSYRGNSKLCGSVRTLLYADRETYVNGLDDILDFMVGRLMDLLGVEHDLATRWDPSTAH